MFEYLFLSQREGFAWSKEIKLKVKEGKLVYKMSSVDINHPAENKVQVVYDKDLDSMLKRIEAIGIPSWNDKYDSQNDDEMSWYLEYKESDKDTKMIQGSGMFPNGFDTLTDLLAEIAEN